MNNVDNLTHHKVRIRKNLNKIMYNPLQFTLKPPFMKGKENICIVLASVAFKIPTSSYKSVITGK
jgi:hypothetical protein